MMPSAGDRVSAANILLVDDNGHVREITAMLLRDRGYNVIEASNGNAALAALDANPAIDLLIVDFTMPGMSGVDLLEQARIKRPEIRAVFITGYVDHTRLGEKFAGEVVVRKPFTMDQLAPAVRAALGQSKG
jgi:CheY-like chemotaxis protein